MNSNRTHQRPLMPAKAGIRRLLAGCFLLWSIAVYGQTPARPDITAAEYYIDADPGVGSATAVSVTAGREVDGAFSVDMSVLSEGLHHLFVRAKNTAGVWSLTHTHAFFLTRTVRIPPDLVAAEYFIDDDPGFGNATPLPDYGRGQFVTHAMTIDIEALSDTIHHLSIRVLDTAGRWSLVHHEAFQKKPPLSIRTKLTPVACHGDSTGAIALTVWGGVPPYTVGWSTGDSIVQQITGLPIGAYTVTVTDSTGTVITQTDTLTQSDPVVVSLTGTPTSCEACADGAIVAEVAGGLPPFTFSWEDSSDTTAIRSGLAVGRYRVIVTDTAGCTGTADIFVGVVPPTPVITPSDTVYRCFGDSVLLTSDITETITWSTGDTTVSIYATRSGPYAVTHTDSLGYTATSDTV